MSPMPSAAAQVIAVIRQYVRGQPKSTTLKDRIRPAKNTPIFPEVWRS